MSSAVYIKLLLKKANCLQSVLLPSAELPVHLWLPRAFYVPVCNYLSPSFLPGVCGGLFSKGQHEHSQYFSFGHQ